MLLNASLTNFGINHIHIHGKLEKYPNFRSHGKNKKLIHLRGDIWTGPTIQLQPMSSTYVRGPCITPNRWVLRGNPCVPYIFLG